MFKNAIHLYNEDEIGMAGNMLLLFWGGKGGVGGGGESHLQINSQLRSYSPHKIFAHGMEFPMSNHWKICDVFKGTGRDWGGCKWFHWKK
jgi:hypothetical protein